MKVFKLYPHTGSIDQFGRQLPWIVSIFHNNMSSVEASMQNGSHSFATVIRDNKCWKVTGGNRDRSDNTYAPSCHNTVTTTTQADLVVMLCRGQIVTFSKHLQTFHVNWGARWVRSPLIHIHTGKTTNSDSTTTVSNKWQRPTPINDNQHHFTTMSDIYAPKPTSRKSDVQCKLRKNSFQVLSYRQRPCSTARGMTVGHHISHRDATGSSLVLGFKETSTAFFARADGQ